MYRKPVAITVKILTGTTTSGTVVTRDHVIVGLIVPAAFTGTAITFLGCDTPTGTFVPVYDSDNNQVSVAVTAAGRGFGLSGAEADALAPFPFVQLVSNAPEGADRSIVVLLK